MHAHSYPLFRSYVDSVRVRAEHAKALAQQIVNSAPADSDASEQQALVLITVRAGAIEATLWDREQVSAEKIGELRNALIVMAGGLHGALQSAARVPRRVSDRGARAERVLRALLPDGLAFTNGDAPAVWAAAVRRIHAIDADLRRNIGEIVGADMLLAFEQATAALGEAIGAGQTPREIPSSSVLAEQKLKFSRAVGRYCRTLSAKVDDDDAVSIERYRKAVAPIDEYRAAHPVARAEEDVDAHDGEDPDVGPAPVVAPITPPTE